MKTLFVKPAEVKRSWFIIDANGKRLGRIATKVAHILRGKHRPYYTPHQEIGDFVIIINADKVDISGRKRENKVYYHHTGYVGGLKETTFAKMIERKPIQPLEMAVRGMLPKGPLGRQLFTNVKVYAGPNHPHAAQQPVAIEL